MLYNINEACLHGYCIVKCIVQLSNKFLQLGFMENIYTKSVKMLRALE